MIVVDANVWVVSLVDSGELGDRLRAVLEADNVWAAPTHAAVEVLRTLRRFERRGHLSVEAADRMADQVIRRPVRYAAARSETLEWVWRRRHSFSFYDAPYVFLAGRLGVPLVTLDRPLAKAAEAIGVATVVPT